MKLFLLILTLLLVFAAPLYVFAAIPLNLDYPTFGGLDLSKDQDLESLAKWVYSAIVIISGLAAFVMLVWGGITWMSSAGSPTAISDAKERIKSALLGLLLVLASFLILQVVNPELTVLKIPTL
jgi:hypothetical protein